MQTCKYLLPEHWATALFYGDTSSFNKDEKKAYDSFVLGENLPDPLSVTDEPEFTEDHDAQPYGVLACNCLTYTFPGARVRILNLNFHV